MGVKLTGIDGPDTLRLNPVSTNGNINMNLPSGGGVTAEVDVLADAPSAEEFELSILQNGNRHVVQYTDVPFDWSNCQYGADTPDCGFHVSTTISFPDTSRQIVAQYENGKWDGVKPGDATWEIRLVSRGLDIHVHDKVTQPFTISSEGLPIASNLDLRITSGPSAERVQDDKVKVNADWEYVNPANHGVTQTFRLVVMEATASGDIVWDQSVTRTMTGTGYIGDAHVEAFDDPLPDPEFSLGPTVRGTYILGAIRNGETLVSKSFTIPAAQQPPDGVVQSLSLGKQTVTPGESTTVEVRIENVGGPGAVSIPLKVDGQQKAVFDLTMEKGEVVTRSKTISITTAGDYTISVGEKTTTLTVEQEKEPQPQPGGELSIRGVSTSRSTVTPGESIRFTLTTNNTTNASQQVTVVFRLGGTEVGQTQTTVETGDDRVSIAKTYQGLLDVGVTPGTYTLTGAVTSSETGFTGSATAPQQITVAQKEGAEPQPPEIGVDIQGLIQWAENNPGLALAGGVGAVIVFRGLLQ